MSSDCPVCGGCVAQEPSTAAKGHADLQYHLYACANCSVQHWQPLIHPTASFYESEELTLYRDLHEGNRPGVDPRSERFFREMPKFTGPALDVGCSAGTFLDSLKRRTGAEVWGIDIDRKALDVAKGRGIENVRRATVAEFVEEARHRNLKFGLVTAFDVIEHLTDPVGAIRDLTTIMAPGGWFMGTVPNRKRVFVNNLPIDFPPHHFFRFDDVSMNRTLAAAGLEACRVESFQYNYAVTTAVEIVLERVRRNAKSLRSQHHSPSNGAGGRPGNSRRKRSIGSLAHQVTVAVTKVAGAPVSWAIEIPAGRGFKLFFMARVPQSGAPRSTRYD